MERKYDGPERRSSPDTIMLMDKIGELAVIVGQTSTSIQLLREDVADIKKNVVTEPEVENIVNSKIADNRRWNIGTLIASIAAAGGIGIVIKR